MSDFYFTFGTGQMGFPGYAKVTAPDAYRARETMVKYYGQKWSGQYPSLHFVAQSDRILQDSLVWPE